MFIYESKVGKKHQTVEPMQVRETANIQEGNTLIREVGEGNNILVHPQKSKTAHLASLNQRTYGSFAKASQHVAEEKAKWDS